MAFFDWFSSRQLDRIEVAVNRIDVRVAQIHEILATDDHVTAEQIDALRKRLDRSHAKLATAVAEPDAPKVSNR